MADKQTVAVVGSGMAGLVAAFLLQQDKKGRYDVQLFETQDHLSLDSASYTITKDHGHDSTPYRIDLPMRAFDDNFHNNLKRMYDYFGIQYGTKKFIYPLTTLSRRNTPHFIYSSANHQMPPIRPPTSSYASWIIETAYLGLCYFWLTLCCFFVQSKEATAQHEEESLRQYLERIWLPHYFIRTYVCPMLTSITTCSHEELLDFPAKDFVEFAKKTYRRPRYYVTGGVHHVQATIANGLSVKLRTTVTSVEHTGTEARVIWVEGKKEGSAVFDHVVMAVTPNVVGAIYQPLRDAMKSIPVVPVQSIIHRDAAVIPECGEEVRVQATKQDNQRDVLHICSDDNATETHHEHPSSVYVTNFPISPIDPSKIIHHVQFSRTLRSVKSRRIVNQLMGNGIPIGQGEKEQLWRNGDGNVWLVGSWCYDGMVLLEGCMESAMTVAERLGVEVPWVDKSD
ncbi:hypothetical protein SI65_07246 [Aspergillus cristatus]|uniref:Amine oxidase domain-containing protein n=1 Tax=Aspergillus cristatus TaxID=573508 RepID=A0A1E3B9U4_ASPCR|nr:hypothetical protein SI65_07246 [Aspergillus cristatus]